MPDRQGAALSAVDLTRELVRIPSENPTGTEADIAAWVRDWLAGLPGVTVKLIEVKPGRPNVIARLAGSSDEPPLAFVAHMDTVPFGSGWQRNPCGADIVDGKLFGRGACDMKSGLAVAMIALAQAAGVGHAPRRTVMLCATMDEEGPLMMGVNNLVDTGVLDANTLVLATEPSDLKVVVAHKGLVWIEVEAHGKLAHAGNPQVGVDAIRAAAEFIVEMKRAVDMLPHRHPLLGRTEITFSGISGGIKTNVVPDHARLEMDIRVPPPMTIEDVHSLVSLSCRAAQTRVPGCRLAFRQINNNRPPVEADAESAFTRALLESASEVIGARAETAVFPAYTDASVVQARTANRNCLVFGPGSLAQAHTVDEFVPIKQVELAASILGNLVQRVCFKDS
jgi:succinyl-diaminopimelate desuccinylase